MAKMTREQFIKKYGLGPGGTFLADDRGGNAASEVAGQSVADYYDRYLADGVAPRTMRVGGDGSTEEVPWNWGGGTTRDGIKQQIGLDAWTNVDPHPESNQQNGWDDAWQQIGKPIAMGAAMYSGIGALNGMAGAGAAGATEVGGATATPVYGSGGAVGTSLPSTGAAAGNLGFSGSMAMPELGASMPAGVTSFSSAIPASAPAAGSWMPAAAGAGTLGGATAIGTGAQIGAGTAAEGAATMGGGASNGLMGTLKDYGGTASSFLKDNPMLTQIGGAALGALASKDQTQSSSNSRDPWGPAQPYLLDNLKTNANAQEYYRANPFSDLQKQQYQGLFNSLANSQANVPGLLANASNFGKSSRGQMPAMTGLLSGTQAPAIDWTQYQNIGRK